MRNRIDKLRFLIVASLVLPVVALAQPVAGDPASGRKTATALCGTCHQVTGGEGRDSPASFVDIANMTSTTALSLKVFLRSGHKEMPNLIIDSSDTDDLIAYILSLSASRRSDRPHALPHGAIRSDPAVDHVAK
ncbi:cytochrome c [Bradyrhizobium sp. th.b2]|uniref:cytochrome c n=1 Tax=Bradyrhizobium sp. th-b2 TaxID=172088 RepID=UPI0018DE45CE|nr:cytochrome c [Bradyrhizobium sp. th.b2]